MTDRIDGPVATGGFVALTGWAADPEGTPVSKIEIRMRGFLPGEARRGGLRPDVMAHFGRSDYLWAGWSGTISLRGVPPGKHTLEVFAVSGRGAEVPCGKHEILVKDVPVPPERPPWRIAVELLGRTLLFLLWLAFVGWVPARLFGSGPAGLVAPVLGLTLFAVAAEAGGALHVRPLYSGACLTALSGIAWLFLFGGRPVERPRPRHATLTTLACAAAFAGLGAIPLWSHGEGAVLGDIDDAIRECMVAESVTLYGWRVPADMRGNFQVMRDEWRKAHGRTGDIYALSALAQAFGVRSHEVYSVAMLAGGCLVIFGAGHLAFGVLRAVPKFRWLAPALTAVNSTLIATLYGQHLATFFAAALLLLFLAYSLRLATHREKRAVVPLALVVASGWTLYPEATPLWIVAVAFSLLLPHGLADKRRAAARFVLVFLTAGVLNPVGLARVARAWTKLSGAKTLETPYNRMVTGDTHYYPSLNVITGLEAYRQDAPAPVNRLRRALIVSTTGLILFVSFLGWQRLSSRERRILLVLLGPPALALYANWQLHFPYGFAKILPLAVPVWAVAFVLLAARAGESERRRGRATLQSALATGTLALTLLLALPSARHVVHHALRSVPSYDPAFRSLPALVRAVGRDAVLRIEEPLAARRAWMIYFVGTNAVETNAAEVRYPGARYFLLVDRREQSMPPSGDVVVSSRDFDLVRIPNTVNWRS